jgi:hypothetical protein
MGHPREVDMRCITLFVLLCAKLAAAHMRPEWTVLYGHEEFRQADAMLQENLRKARSKAEADREEVIASIRTPVAEVSRRNGRAFASHSGRVPYAHFPKPEDCRTP